MTNQTRLNGEEGWALVTAVAVMSIMLIMGLTTVASIDFSSGENRRVREREASLNLAEGVLYAQAFTLARKWPSAAGAVDTRFPGICTSAVALDALAKCPNRDNLEASNSQAKAGAAFRSSEFAADGKWTTRVRDNYGQLAVGYDTRFSGENVTLSNGTVACPQVPCAYDFNDDKAMWVESRTEVRGEARKVVALMKLEVIQESVPRVGIAAGAIALTNNGAASYDVTGASATVNCTPDPPAPNSAGTCTNYKSPGQVNPAPTRGSGQLFMTADQIERFRERAAIDKKYYSGKVGEPSCPPLHGQVVFIEKMAALNCDYNGTNNGTVSAACAPAPPQSSGMQNPCVNQLTRPGIVIVRCGGFTTSGNWTFVGILYFVNGSDGTCPAGQVRGTTPPAAAECPKNGSNGVIYESSGGAGIWGALAVDGNACVRLGSNSQLQVLFDPNVFNAVSSYGTVGLVQNTWRELPPGTN